MEKDLRSECQDAANPATSDGAKSEPDGERGTPADVSSRPDDLEEIRASIGEVAQKLGELNEIVHARLTYDAAKEAAFDRLYAELEPLKTNASFDQLRPLYLDLILLFDRIQNICPEDAGEESCSGLYAAFRSLSDELLEILYRRDIEVVQGSSTVFDPTVQRAIGVENVESEREAGQVARVVRRGFRYQNRLVRPEEVIVKTFVQSTT